MFEKLKATIHDIRTAAHEIAAKHGYGKLGEAAIANAIIGFTVAAVIIGITVTILYSISSSMPVIDANNTWNATQVAVNATTVSSMNLLVVVLVIIAAGILIGAIMMFRRQTQGGGGM